jgi:hypothetical protein
MGLKNWGGRATGLPFFVHDGEAEHGGDRSSGSGRMAYRYRTDMIGRIERDRMPKTIAVAILLPILAAGCTRPAQLLPLRLTPEQAVFNAAGSPHGVSGTFEMVGRSTGTDHHGLYLNSELDYRDQRSLTVAVRTA